MKKLKRLFVTIMAIVMLCVCSFSFSGCIERIKKVQIEIEVYNYAESTMETHTLHVDLYHHLAPNTVDKMAQYIQGGHYDDTIFYKMGVYAEQMVMIGDLKYNSEVVLNEVKPQIEQGEFKHGGTVGSNLKAKKGSIGLWRSWYELDGNYASTNATDTGRATWFMPIQTVADFNDYFCIFAQYDVENQDNKDAINAITNAFSNEENFERYVIYYTGEYDENDADNNYGLTFNCATQDTFDAIKDSIDVFEAEGEQLVGYNATTVLIPFYNGNIAARIVSAKLV